MNPHPLSAYQVSRRDFLQKTGSLMLAAPWASPLFSLPDTAPAAPFNGIQISPYNLFDEGIAPCLDLLQETAGVNALFCYSQTYHQGYNRPMHVMADHGFPIKGVLGRKLPRIWVRTEKRFYRDTRVGHQAIDPSFEYAGRDLFRELHKPARERGMKVYARILEASANRSDLIPHYDKVLTVDIEGKQGRGPCWNHPEYRAWVLGTVRDLVSNYDLDGLQYGAERTGPLSYLLYSGLIPTCFCTHCYDRNRNQGIDPDRAKEGYTQLYAFIRQVHVGARPADGVMAGVYRYFQLYPEILSWNYQWFQADNEIHQQIYDAAKSIRPEIAVGRHVDHQRSSWDIWYRAAVPYADMTASADFIKPILYHDILGPRLRHWVIGKMHRYAWADMSEADILALFYAQFGHDAAQMPALDELETKGLGASYVYKETLRCVNGVAGKSKVYAGVGIDVPWHLPEGGMQAMPSPRETTIEAVKAAFEAGADGLLISREYDEMRLESLRAIGEALRQ